MRAKRGSRNGEQSTRTADADLILEYYLYVVGIPAGCGILTGLDAPEDHDSHLASRRRSGSDIQLAFSRPVTPYLGSARVEVKVVREFVISRPHFTHRECPRIGFGQTDRDPRFLETRVRDGSDGAVVAIDTDNISAASASSVDPRITCSLLSSRSPRFPTSRQTFRIGAPGEVTCMCHRRTRSRRHTCRERRPRNRTRPFHQSAN